MIFKFKKLCHDLLRMTMKNRYICVWGEGEGEGEGGGGGELVS
jgi:hypothetical protein